jgi:hypothetical protein
MTLVNSYIPDSQLYHDLKQMGRDNFSYDGALALMEYLEQLSEDIGENIEYDPIAFCCDFAEYSDALECVEGDGYDCDFSDCEDEEDKQKTAIEFLHENTTVIEFNGGIIVQAF